MRLIATVYGCVTAAVFVFVTASVPSYAQKREECRFIKRHGCEDSRDRREVNPNPSIGAVTAAPGTVPPTETGYPPSTPTPTPTPTPPPDHHHHHDHDHDHAKDKDKDKDHSHHESSGSEGTGYPAGEHHAKGDSGGKSSGGGGGGGSGGGGSGGGSGGGGGKGTGR